MLGSQASGINIPGLLGLVVVLAVVFFPLLLGRSAPSKDSPDSSSEDGPGGGPPRPPRPPDSPLGGIPLPDADPSALRLRDHRRLTAIRAERSRRGAPSRRRGPGVPR